MDQNSGWRMVVALGVELVKGIYAITIELLVRKDDHFLVLLYRLPSVSPLLLQL
jgi:hypothetical protein